MKVSKKILAIALSVVMILSVMPFAAFAADAYTVSTEQELNDAIAGIDYYTGATITLSSNITVTQPVQFESKGTAAAPLVIDLNGNTLTSSASNGYAMYLFFSNVTIKNGTVNGGIAVYGYDGSAANAYVLTIEKNATINASQNFAVGVFDYDGSADGVVINVSGKLTGYSGGIIVQGNVKDEAGNTPVINVNANSKVTGTSAAAVGIYGAGYATWNISGGTVEGKTAIYLKAGNLNVTGGTIKATGEKAAYTPAGSGCNPTGDAIVIENHTGYASVGSVSVSGGTVTTAAEGTKTIAGYSNSEAAAPTATVTGGTFKVNGVADETVPLDDSLYVQDDNGKIYPASEIGTKYNVAYTNASGKTSYKTFDSTVFTANGTYKLLSNVTANVRMTPGIAGSNIVLDMNGYNITSNANDYVLLLNRTGSASAHKTFEIINTSSTPSVIEATKDSCEGVYVNGKYNDFTLGENVTLKTKDVSAWIGSGTNSSITINGDVESSDCYALYVHGNNAGPNTVTVNGNVTGKDAGIYAAGVATYNINGNVTGDTGIYAAQGTINVNDGATVTGTGAANDYVYNGSGMNSTGNAIAADSKYATAPTVNVATGATIESYTTKAYDEYKKDETVTPAAETISENATVIEHNYVAKVGDNYYETLAAAVNAFNTNQGGTITLLTDVEISEPVRIQQKGNASAPLVFDLGGYSITSTAANGYALYSVYSNIEVKNGDVNGALAIYGANNQAAGRFAVKIADDATINSTQIAAVNVFAVSGSADGVILDVYGTISSANNAAITVNGQITDREGSILAVNVNEGAVVECTDPDGAGIYAAGYANYNIYGTVTGATGIYQKGGSLTVNEGAVVAATGAKNAPVESGGGYTSTGEAITVENTTTHPYGSTYIAGGLISSANADAVGSYALATATAAGKAAPAEIIPATSKAVFSSDVSALAEDGYKTVYDESKGGYVVEEEVQANNGSSLTLTDGVKFNAYVDADAYGVDANEAVVKLTYNHNADVSKTKAVSTDTIALADATKYVKAGDPYDGTYKFAFAVAPAQYAEDITIELYATADAETPLFTTTTNVKSMCEKVIALAETESAYAAYANLCKALADYCQAAQVFFSYDAPASPAYYNDAVTTLAAADMEVPAAFVGIEAAGFSFTIVSALEVNVFYNGDLDIQNVSINSTKGADAVKAETTIKGGKNCINITGIASGNLDNMITVNTSAGVIELSATNIAKAIAGSADTNYANLARALYLYSVQASAFFGA